jgi:hypothetical protein
MPARSKVTSVRHDAPRPASEGNARAAIEARAGRLLTDAEWVAERSRLVEFASILRDWDRKALTSRRGNVEVSCQQEP